MRIDIDVLNLNQVLDAIEDIGNSPELRQGLERACALVERKAKEKAPKDTGALRRSITSEITHEGGNLTGVVFTPLEYAPYVEYGTGLFAEKGGRKDVPWVYQDDKGEWHSTSGQKPQPFMRPALNENREEIIRIIKEALIND
jgi:HK97 gp10 family phage protein